MNVENGTLTSDAIAALEQGRLIEAIKLTRTATGMGLKESKDTVEAYLDNHPALKEKIDATRISIGFTQEQGVILLIAVALLMAYFVFAR
jgi:hypothetical protein